MIFVHVHRKNTPAQELYSKLGFEVKVLKHRKKKLPWLCLCLDESLYEFVASCHQVVDVASLQLVEEQMYLLCCKT